ncbi:hypothetical protein, partial [Iodidimonas gelatinilytica]|uniref:hypothetical protein n=1 Tax=Iodidimonas gelatinilytica TaxID=1236966 RepID=UPI00123046EC
MPYDFSLGRRLTPEQRMDAWLRGALKSHAHYQLVREPIRKQYLRLRKAKIYESGRWWRTIMQAKAQDHIQFNQDTGKFTNTFPVSDRKHADKYQEMDERLKKRILNYVHSGELIALGFVKPRRPEDYPVEVPADYWRGNHSFSNDDVHLGSLKMETVKLIPRPWIKTQFPEKIEHSEIVAADHRLKKTRRSGPDSKMALIVAAYKTLVQQGTFTPSDGNSLIAYHVREYILDNN